MKRFRVLVVDDHAIFRRGLMDLLSETSDLEVVGEAENGVDAVTQTCQLKPDVVVMDLRMKHGDGMTAIRQIKDLGLVTRTLVVSEYDDDIRLAGALQAGAHGYYVKTDRPNDILRGIVAVARGDAAFGAGVARKVLTFLATMDRPMERPGRVFPQLSGREHEILELLAQGKGNAVIARELGIVPKTVKNHVAAILRKLQSINRADAAAKAREHGLGVTPGSESQPT